MSNSYIEHLRPDGDTSLGLEPVKVFGDSGEGSRGARLAASGRAERHYTNFGCLAVGLSDDQGAARVAVAGSLRATVGINADLGVVDDRAVIVSALAVVDDGDVDELQFGADSRDG
jgi:hypothetical protein